MELSFYGAGCVLVSTKQLKVLIDPPGAESGIKLPNLKPDVVLHTAIQGGEVLTEGHFEIDSPGEYEVKGVGIQGIAAQLHIDKPEDPPRGVMYVLEAGDLRLLATGSVASDLNEAQLEAVGDIDILVVQVGGHGLTLDASAAARLTSQLEPSYVVPVHYDDGKTKYPMPQEKLETFLKEAGAEASKPEPKLKVSAKEITEETRVVTLAPAA